MIVTLEMIKQEIGRTDDFHDELIARKLTEAEAIILDYLKLDADAYDDVDGNIDAPIVVASGIILATKNLYDDPEADPLSPAVKNIVHRYRDPALA